MTTTRRLAFYAAALATVATLGSCGRGTTLADNLAGNWAGTPQRLIDTDASSATIIQTFDFQRHDSIDQGGPLSMSALMSVTGALDGSAGIATPVSLTASGYATVSGTWRVAGSDKVELRLDLDSLKVVVDPEAVIMSTNATNPSPASDHSSLTALKPQLAKSIEEQMRAAVLGRYAPEMTFTGLRLNSEGNILTFRYNGRPATLSRQP